MSSCYECGANECGCQQARVDVLVAEARAAGRAEALAEVIDAWSTRLHGLTADDPERIRIQAMFWDLSHLPGADR